MLMLVVCVAERRWCSINVSSVPLFQVGVPVPSRQTLRSTVDLPTCARYAFKFHELNRLVSL